MEVKVKHLHVADRVKTSCERPINALGQALHLRMNGSFENESETSDGTTTEAGSLSRKAHPAVFVAMKPRAPTWKAGSLSIVCGITHIRGEVTEVLQGLQILAS